MPRARTLAFFVATPFLVVTLLVLFQPMDGDLGWFASVVAAKADTVYAPGYGDAAFKKVSKGMTEREGAALLGEPLDMYSVPEKPDLVAVCAKRARFEPPRSRDPLPGRSRE